MIVKTFEFNPVGVNTYIIYDETKSCAIIDPGCFFPEEQEDLINFITENDLEVKLLLNTHGHFDHIFGNNFVEEQFGVKAKMHKEDLFLLEGLPAQLRMYGFANEGKIPQIDSFLEEGDKISFGNQELEVFHVPGHSPGSITLYNAKEGCIFVGDVLFKSSIGRTDLAGGNYSKLINNIREKLLPLPPKTIVYSGHGPATTIGEETEYNPFL